MAQKAEESDDEALATLARELYAHVPAEFVAARNARAAEVRRDGDRELARRVKALPKASVSAWAVLALARENPEELDALGELGAELRVAQAAADPAELRALGRRRRELTAALARTAARLAAEREVALSTAAQEQVEATLHAVVIDPDAERAVRSLLLVRALDPGDLGTPADALAAPGALPAEGEDDVEEEAAPSSSQRRSGREARRPQPSTRSAAPEPAEADPSGEVVWSKGGLTRRRRRGENDAGTTTDQPRHDDEHENASDGPERRRGGGDAPRSTRRRSGAVGTRRAEATSAEKPAASPARGDESARPPARSSGDVARETRRLQRELRARERAAEQARTDLEEAKEELSRVEAEVLRVAARIEELRRELGKREEELAGLDEDRAVAREEREDAEDLAEAAERAVEQTREQLTELTD